MSQVVFIFPAVVLSLGRVQESRLAQLVIPEWERGHVDPSCDLRQLHMALDIAPHTPFLFYEPFLPAVYAGAVGSRLAFAVGLGCGCRRGDDRQISPSSLLVLTFSISIT